MVTTLASDGQSSVGSAQHHAAPQLFCELVSLSTDDIGDVACRAAAILDDAGALAPDRGGASARTARLKADRLAGVVESAVQRGRPGGLWIVFERSNAGLWGDMRFHEDLRMDTDPRSHSVGFTMAGDTEAAVQLLCALFEAVDGFYGRADTVAMRDRRLTLRTTAADDGRMWLPRWDDRRFVIWDRWVEDVWWVNLFGPAYLEHWGADVVNRLGVRRQPLANGGIAVWSSRDPVDPQASGSIAGFAHKQPFYDVLGIDTFIHESLHIPEPGERVPALQQHARSSHTTRVR